MLSDIACNGCGPVNHACEVHNDLPYIYIYLYIYKYYKILIVGYKYLIYGVAVKDNYLNLLT